MDLHSNSFTLNETRAEQYKAYHITIDINKNVIITYQLTNELFTLWIIFASKMKMFTFHLC